MFRLSRQFYECFSWRRNLEQNPECFYRVHDWRLADFRLFQLHGSRRHTYSISWQPKWCGRQMKFITTITTSHGIINLHFANSHGLVSIQFSCIHITFRQWSWISNKKFSSHIITFWTTIQVRSGQCEFFFSRHNHRNPVHLSLADVISTNIVSSDHHLGFEYINSSSLGIGHHHSSLFKG